MFSHYAICNISPICKVLTFLRTSVFSALGATLKELYSCPKKLYQYITNLFFLASIPTPDQVQYQVGQLALERDIYLCDMIFAQRYMATPL